MQKMRMKPLRRIILSIFLFIAMISVAPPGIWSQQQDLSKTEDFTGFQSSSFANDLPRAESTARIAAWSPDEGMGYIAVRYVYPDGYHQIDSEEYFKLVPEPAAGVVFGSTIKPKPVIKDGLKEYFDETTVILEFRTAEDAPVESLKVNALFQICDVDGVCLFPDSEFHEIPFSISDAALAADPELKEILEWSAQSSEYLLTAEASETGMESDSSISSNALLQSASASLNSLWIFLLLSLIGGILLNVMPCVLPLLSVKALGLVQQADSERKKILRHALIYVLGIEVSFWILAGIVVALQTSGRLIGWGFQFQSPAFVLSLIVVMWIFAFSLFDVFIIEAPRKGMEGASAAGLRGGYTGSFLTGVFAVFVATPCTAPFLGAALGFAFSQSPLVIFSTFSIIGIGFGIPYLLLGIWPRIIEKLPKPGAWMQTFKGVMGFLMLGSAVYLFTTFIQLAPASVNGVLWWLLILGFAAWIFGKVRQPGRKRALRILGQLAVVIVAVVSGFVFIDLSADGREGQITSQYSKIAKNEAIDFDEADILRRIDRGETIFLEFSAAWCTTCKINQRVINDDAVQKMMKEKKAVHIIADLTAYNETLTKWLADFGRAGVPLYVLYTKDEEPHIFPEFITVNMMLEKLEKIGS